MEFQQTKWSVIGTICLTMLLSFLACMMRVVCLERCCKANDWTLCMLNFTPVSTLKGGKSKSEE
jgi:hypothetical protein